MKKVLKLINLSLSGLMAIASIFLLAVEIYHISALNFFLFEHPFNGLIRNFSRILSLVFLISFYIISIYNIFKNSDIRNYIVMYTSFGSILVSIFFFFYIDLFIAIIYVSFNVIIDFIHFYVYFFVPNKEKYMNTVFKKKEKKKDKKKDNERSFLN